MNLEKLSPAFQDYLWGGTKLRDLYGKHCDLGKVAESWELSTHPAGREQNPGGPVQRPDPGPILAASGESRLGQERGGF